MKRFINIAITLFAIGGMASAQSAFDAVRIVENENGFGARALAMGGAYTGLANDYTAIYWNPAGLADLRKSQFFGEVSHLQFNNSATFNGNLTDESQNYTRLRSLGLAFPLPTRQGSFVMALGYNRVKDFDQQLIFSGFNQQSNGLEFEISADEQSEFYPFDRDVYQTERISDEGGLNQWSLAAGVALSPNFTAGITLNAWSGESEYSFQFLQEDRNNVYPNFPYDPIIPLDSLANFESYLLKRNLNSDYSAVGMKIGGMFHLNEAVRIGGAVSFPVTFTVEEVFTESDELVFDDGFVDAIDYEPGRFEYEVKTPFFFDGGASFSNKLVTLSGSFRYRDWSQTRFKVDDRDLGDPDFADLQEENDYIRENFRATLEYRLGGEFYLRNLNAYLRGGYAFIPSPLKDVSGDFDKKYISGGLGFVLDRFVTLDVTYQHGSWKNSSEDNLTPGITEEDISTNKVLMGITYRF